MIRKEIYIYDFDFYYIRPSHCAVLKGNLDCLKRLIKHNADIWIQNKRGDYPIHELVNAMSSDKARHQKNDFSQLQTECFGRRKIFFSFLRYK